jgi:hypothetical protein
VLDGLGDPSAIADTQRPHHDRLRGAGHARERWGVMLSAGRVGGRCRLVGGLLLLWTSPVWTTRDKWIGTPIVPEGLAPVPFVQPNLVEGVLHFARPFGSSQCTGSPTAGTSPQCCCCDSCFGCANLLGALSHTTSQMAMSLAFLHRSPGGCDRRTNE